MNAVMIILVMVMPFQKGFQLSGSSGLLDG
jgi:hypothetical protein